jgi:putative flavoprotein involved in K+ transport
MSDDDGVVVGAGQAGLAVGYCLARRGCDFLILDSNERVGDGWRRRWDSLRLFTPARYSGLPGMPFAAAAGRRPTKDETADYLEEYATRFHLPVRPGVSVESMTRRGDLYTLTAGSRRFETRVVVVATGPYQSPRTPPFASALDPRIAQLHSSGYRKPGDLPDGGVLVVGAGNSGAEIALELAQTCRTWLSGRDTGRVPLRLPGRVLWWPLLTHLNVDSKVGRRFKAMTSNRGDPVVGISARDFARAGVERLPRTSGVRDGKPVLEDGRVVDAGCVVWATGFAPDFAWVSLPIFGDDGYPVHHRGVVEREPGLYFVGLRFLYTLTSSFIGGVGADAEYIARHIAARSGAHGPPSPAVARGGSRS